MFQLEQSTLECEGMNLMYLRIESPRIFQSIVCLDLLHRKWIESYKIPEKSTAFCDTFVPSLILLVSAPCEFLSQKE